MFEGLKVDEEEGEIVIKLIKKRILDLDENDNLVFILKPGMRVSYLAEPGAYGFAKFVSLEGGTAILKAESYDEEEVRCSIMKVCNQEAEGEPESD